MLHRVMHWLGFWVGNVTVWTGRDGYTWVAYVCDECGMVTGAHRANIPFQPANTTP